MGSPDAVSHRRRTAPTQARLTRIEAGLTQAELAEMAGLSREAVSMAESGRPDSRLSTLRALANALGCRVADLLDNDERRPGRDGARELTDMDSTTAERPRCST